VSLTGLYSLTAKVEAIVGAITLSGEVTGFEAIETFSLKT
jgi:hypothetical protein